MGILIFQQHGVVRRSRRFAAKYGLDPELYPGGTLPVKVGEECVEERCRKKIAPVLKIGSRWDAGRAGGNTFLIHGGAEGVRKMRSGRFYHQACVLIYPVWGDEGIGRNSHANKELPLRMSREKSTLMRTHTLTHTHTHTYTYTYPSMFARTFIAVTPSPAPYPNRTLTYPS